MGTALALIAGGAIFLALSYDPQAFGLSYHSVFPFGGGFLGLFLIFWGMLFLVRIAFWASRGGRYGGGPGGGARRFDPAILEARRRYARGEITREQFEQIVADLRRPPGPLP